MSNELTFSSFSRFPPLQCERDENVIVLGSERDFRSHKLDFHWCIDRSEKVRKDCMSSFRNTSTLRVAYVGITVTKTKLQINYYFEMIFINFP